MYAIRSYYDKSIAQFSAQIGDAYFALNERDSVIKYYDIAIKYNNEDKLLLNNYAYYLSVFNINLSLAESMASKCVSIDPGNYTFLDTYAWVLFRKNRITSYNVCYTKLLRFIFNNIVYKNSDLNNASKTCYYF